MVIKAFEALISKGPQLVDHERWFTLNVYLPCISMLCSYL